MVQAAGGDGSGDRSGDGSGALQVNLLGPVEVRRAGHLVDLGGPQQRAVIAHLALDLGRVVSVERLIGRLWGDGPPGQPLGALQSYVSRLRKALEPGRTAGAASTVLVSEAPGYALLLAPDQVDVGRFEQLAAAGRDAAAGDRHEAALAHFDAALGVWRGPALAGLGPDEEVGPIVLRLDEERTEVEEARFDSLLALGRHAEMVGPLQTAVADHPLRERRWAQLALALYRSGRQADRVRAVATARDTLVDQLGLDPGPELRELERQILDQDPRLLAPPQVVDTVAGGHAAGGEPSGPMVVGRATEWETMRSALAGVSSGAGLLLVEGEPGIGKSTLLEALAAKATATGYRLAVTRCAEPGLAPALWPWIEIVRTLIGPDGEHSSLAGLSAASGPAGPTDSISPVEQATAIAALLATVASQAPLLVVLDDLHWADRPTLDLLTMTLERVADVPLLVAAGHRPADLVAGSPFATALGRLTLLPAATRLRLPGLSTNDVARLMTIVGGHEPSAEVAGRVRARTDGNPLFVAELARLAGASGLGDDDVVPDAVRDVVRSRLARLPALTQDVLATAAVIGQDVELRVLAEASGHTLDDTLDAVDAAIVTRILVPTEAGGLRFAHALVRDAVLAELAPLRRARLHLRAADAIEAVHGADADHAEPIAWQRWAAVDVDDPDRVAVALILAGDTARVHSAYERAEELLDEALTVIRRLRPGTRRSELEVSAMESLLSLETVRSFMGLNLANLADRIDEIAARNESSAIRQLGLFTRWSKLNADGPASTVAVAAEALAAAEQADDPYTIILGRYVAGSQSFLSGTGVAAAREHYTIAIATEDAARAAGVVMLPPATVPGMAALAAALGGDEAATAALLDRQFAVLKDRRDDGAEVDGVFFQSLTLAIRDDAEAVRRLTAFTLDPAPRSWLPHFSPLCRVLHVWATIELGNGPALLDVATAALAELDDGPTTVAVSGFRTFHATALLRLDDPDALEMLRQARRDAEELGDRWWLPETLRLLAIAEQRFGDPAARPALLAEAEEVAAAAGATVLTERLVTRGAREI